MSRKAGIKINKEKPHKWQGLVNVYACVGYFSSSSPVLLSLPEEISNVIYQTCCDVGERIENKQTEYNN